MNGIDGKGNECEWDRVKWKVKLKKEVIVGAKFEQKMKKVKGKKKGNWSRIRKENMKTFGKKVKRRK